MTPEEEIKQVTSALAHYRDSQFSVLLVTAIQLAAFSHPEELRKALGTVFDLKGFEDCQKRLMVVVASVQQYAQQAQELCRSISDDIEHLNQRMDAIDAALGRHEATAETQF